jgi:hypothetical protein
VLLAFIPIIAGSYFALQNSWVQTKITNQVASRLSKRLNTKITVGKVEIGFFNKLLLEDVLIEDQKHDTLLFSHLITAKIDTFRLNKQLISINELTFKNNKLNISRDSSDVFNFNFILNAIGQSKEKDTLNLWKIRCNRFNFGQLNIAYNNEHSLKNAKFLVQDLNLNVSEFYSIADSLSFKINQLSFNSDNKLTLEKASAQVVVKNKTIDLSQLNFKSKYSEISNTSLNLQFYNQADSMNVPFDVKLRIEKSNLNLREISELWPAVKGMDQVVELSGLIYGNFNDSKGKNLVLRTGTDTEALLDFYVNEIDKPENMYLFLDLKQSSTSFSDIGNIRFPNTAKRKHFEFPASFYETGKLKFKGNFSGFLSDFVTFGTLESEMGVLTTDILVMPEKEGTIYYRGNISTTDFELGRLFKFNNIGNITLNGSADGNFDKTSKAISGVFKGGISEIELNNYIYKNIKFDGLLQEKMFDGMLSINDPNLNFTFLGELDLNEKVPSFDFDLNLKKASPNNLHLGRNFPAAEIAFEMKANFAGNKLDNLEGAIVVGKGYYKNRNGQIDLGGMELKSVPKKNGNALYFTSDFFDATILGNYHFQSIINTSQRIIHHFIPSFDYVPAEDALQNVFDYRFYVKELNKLSQIFVPGLEFETPFLLYGNIDSPNFGFKCNGSLPGIKYQNFWARNIFIGNQDKDNQYSSKFRIGEIFNKNGMSLYNLTIDSHISNNVIDNSISWSNFDELTYSGSIQTQTSFSKPDTSKNQHIEIKGLPSGIYLADTLWSIAPFFATIDSSALTLKGFNFSHRKQVIAAEGKIVGNKTDMLNLSLQNIDLSYLDIYLNQNIQLSGVVNGVFKIANAFEAPIVLSDLNVDDLRYKDQFMGDISLISQWDNLNSAIDSELKIIRNQKQNLKAFGYYKPSTKELNYDVEVDSLSLIVLETFMQRNFSNFKGHATGQGNIGGTLEKLSIYGDILTENAGLTINVTQIPYSFTDTISFRNDTIRFDNITIFDDENNPGNFDGTIVHQNFYNMLFDLSFTSDKLRALNTTSRDNEQFYGTVVAKGRLDIQGYASATQLIGSVTTLPETDVKISMESESEIAQYDFIEFKSPKEIIVNDFFTIPEKESSGELNMSFTVEATPEAKVQLIYNSKIGDVIKAQGEGILLFEINNEGNISLSGNYTPTKGDYLFTLQNVVNKRFSIEPGGSIIWSGDPYNAIVDLKAIYKLKASLYDLLASSYDYESQSQRIQVECIILLSEELNNPTIGFDINFPSADEQTTDKLQQYFNTDEELNKQILSLIVMGKFYTPEYMRGTYEAQNSNTLGTTASEMFSNQLSNWLSQIRSNWDVGINYRPGSELTDDEIELALSTQIFNDRVSLNGNIGNNTNQYTSSSSQIVGEFEMSVKLVPSGKIQLKAYNLSNNNLIYETAPYTQGIGLSFKEEYNSFKELCQKIIQIFKKKNKIKKSHF